MPALTARKLANELQKLIVKHPEAADYPVEAFDGVIDWKVERVVLDLSSPVRRFVLE